MVLLILVVILLSQVELSQVRAPFFVYDTAKKPDRGESARLDDWRRIFAVNVESMFLTTHAFVPQLKQSGHGRIVNMTSNAIGLVIPGQAAYIATKMAVIGLTRGLATELAEYGVTANAIGPSLTHTPGAAAAPAEFFDIVSQLQAIKRVRAPAKSGVHRSELGVWGG